MQIVFDDDGARRELDVQVNNPTATVGDLLDVLAPGKQGATGLLIGGRVAHTDLGLAECGLYEGAVVRLAADAPPPVRPSGPAPTDEGALVLDVVGGVDAGRRFVLHPGEVLVGREPGGDVLLASETISARHAALTIAPTGGIAIRDLGSHNGTWLGDRAVNGSTDVPEGAVLRMGAVQAVVRRNRAADRPLAVDPLRHATAAGTLPFNRPPRPAASAETDNLRAPEPPGPPSSRMPLSVIAILAPVAFGVAGVFLFHSTTFLLFAALSPVMAIGTWIESRRHGRKTGRREQQRYRSEMAVLESALRDRVAAERARREEASPDLAEIVRRATLPSVRLWERRPAHPDFLRLRAGLGDVAWEPPVDVPGDRTEEINALLASASPLPEVPVPVDLSAGGVVGIVGDRAASIALVRALVCQAAVHHGPADLALAVFTRPDVALEWDWVKWLPHTREAGGGNRLLCAERDQSTAMLHALLASGRNDADRSSPNEPPTGPTLLAVVDDESLTEGRRAPARTLLRGAAGPVAGIVLASTADRLPAVCTTVITLHGPDGEAVLDRPQTGERIDVFLAGGMADDVARVCASALARFEDPELEVAGAGLPDRARLLPLLGVDHVDAAAIAQRWRSGGADPSPVAPIGVTEDDVFTIDLVRDGPHGLVAGTTGSGKSELLRTLVAGLAATVDPDHLTFVLIDFKGGSAFDECGRLPHTVGLVTDLDEHLAERALRCLEAELRYRERLLRQTGANDLGDYLRAGTGRVPLPRLLVVIDEFATLKAELPQFVDALVGIAQRGRSLGVHLVLATQRPTGAVSDNIRANTNLRIALRVQDNADSTDVIGIADAAAIPRSRAGRAYVRLGPGEVVAIQTALSTASADRSSVAPVDVAPFRFGPFPRATPTRAESSIGEHHESTDLTTLVDACTAAFEASGAAPPRRPWPEPLPLDVPLESVPAPADAGLVAIGLADDPDAQAQYPAGWRPADGNLMLYGIVGSGTTTALATTALVLAAERRPDDLHLYVMDFGAGDLTALGGLPHTGAVVGATERERQQRLVRFLRGELDRRLQLDLPGQRAEPRIVLLLDGYGAFKADYDDVAGMGTTDDLTRVFADGPEVGISCVITADRAGAVPGALSATVRSKLLFRLADTFEYSTFGLPSKSVPALPPGRAIDVESGHVIHVARPSGPLREAVSRAAASAGSTPPARRPTVIGTLPADVEVDALGAPPSFGDRPWIVPVGLGERDLAPAALVVYDHEHVLVCGPARSGRSTALATIAAVVGRAHPAAVRIVVAGDRSPLRRSDAGDHVIVPSALSTLPGVLSTIDEGSPVFVLVDDAEGIDDESGVLATLSTSPRRGLHLVVAGRSDALRAAYSHWTRQIRRSKLGVLLQPDVDLDGEILGVGLPRRAPVAMVPGRGYLVNSGEVALVQLAR